MLLILFSPSYSAGACRPRLWPAGWCTQNDDVKRSMVRASVPQYLQV